jgi:4-aminobutyrate aminotransferase-like enzyme
MEYFNTFGGNPVSAAVGNAVLDVIEAEGLQAHARAVGDMLMAGLSGLRSVYPEIGDVRGAGLFLGVELVWDGAVRIPGADIANHVVEVAKASGVLLSTDGPDHNVIKIKPPLVFSAGDADKLVAAVHQGLRTWGSSDQRSQGG